MKKEEIDQLISESFERANVKEFWDMYIENICNFLRQDN